VAILADTSIWIDHLRQGNADLASWLETGQILIHPAVVAEIALGSLRDRQTVLTSLWLLPRVETASDEEVIGLIERRTLWNRGIGFVDAHLIASVLLSPGTRLWTRDKRLREAAAAIDLPLIPRPAG